MIVVQMSGGLGNQMFQYALYRRLKSLGRDVRIDDWSQYVPREDGAVVRKLGLGVFGAQYRKASEEEVNLLTDGRTDLLSRIRRKLTGRRSLETRDTDFLFDPRFLETGEGYFTGCFQSERYFAPIGDEIREAFAFPGEFPGMSGKVRALGEKMQSGPSVCLHLRFGDYLEKSDIYGGICTREYYSRAVRLFLSRYGEKAVFYLFSDDDKRAAEAAEQFSASSGAGPEQFVPVPHDSADSTYSDLYLMTKCRNHIIANSSYSWWGSYLARSGGQWVVAPSVWMHGQGGNELRHRDIYREEMILVSPEGRLVRVPAGAAEAAGAPPASEDRDRPLVSVIVPAYNIENYIEGAVKSLLAQTWDRLQIIAVDDGSPDRTGAVLDRIASGESRIRVIHKENGGLSDARNAGLALAEGEFTAYLDGDDRMDPLMIESMVRAAMITAADIVTVRYRQVEEGLAEESGSFAAKDAEEVLARGILLTGHEAVRSYVEEPDEAVVTNSVWSKLFRSSLIKDLQFPKGRNAEDIVYTTKALVRAHHVAHLPCPLYNYLVDRQGSIMNGKHVARRLDDEIPFWREKIKILRESGEDGPAEIAEYRLYRRMLIYWRQFRHPESSGAADGAASAGFGEAGERIARQLYDDRDRIREIASRPFVPAGDRWRFGLFLLSPGLYDSFAGLYEKTIVLLKQKMHKGKTAHG